MTNKEAINLISRNESVFQFDPAMLEALDLAIKALKEIPTVEYPFYAEAYQTGYEEAKKEFERQEGEWISTTKDNGVSYQFFCSNCDREVQVITDYCPYCGADMRGKNNGN